MPTRQSIIVSLTLAAAVALNLWPVLSYSLLGDKVVYLAYLSCFMEGMQQGVFYPRWCMEFNGGQGAPAFYFYFPLPYFITALPDVLTKANLSVDALYKISLSGVTLATAGFAYLWLRGFVSAKIALLGAVFYLFMPYRTELLYARSGFNELWGLMWLPLMLYLYGRLQQGGWRYLFIASLVTALCILSHVPTAVMGMFCGGILALTQRSKRLKALLQLGAVGALALLLTAFYVVPYLLLRPYTNTDVYFTYANTVYWPEFKDYSDYIRAVRVALPILALLLLAVPFWRRWQHVPATAKGWALIALLSVMLLSPLSEPLWRLTQGVSAFTFPWRVQLGFNVALVVLFALYSEHFVTPLTRQRWQGDSAVFLAILLLLPFASMRYLEADGQNLYDKIVARQAVILHEHRTRWTDAAYYGNLKLCTEMEYRSVLARDSKRRSLLRASVVQGKGSVEVTQWDARGIALNVMAKTPVTVKIRQFYFPTWHVNNGALSPQHHTGLMLLKLPKGVHHLRLLQKMKAAFATTP